MKVKRTQVGAGTKVLEDEGAVQEEDVVGVGVEGGAQGGAGLAEGSLSSSLESSVCTSQKVVFNNHYYTQSAFLSVVVPQDADFVDSGSTWFTHITLIAYCSATVPLQNSERRTGTVTLGRGPYRC